MWNANLIKQGNFIGSILSSTCFGYIRLSSGALDVELQHMVFCTEFLDGWWAWEPLRMVPCVRCGWCRATARHHPHRTHDLPSGSQAHHPSKNSVQKTICCNSKSNAPDDGHMRPKHVELRIHQWNYLFASSWHFTLFHEEDAQSNNPQLYYSVNWGKNALL